MAVLFVREPVGVGAGTRECPALAEHLRRGADGPVTGVREVDPRAARSAYRDRDFGEGGVSRSDHRRAGSHPAGCHVTGPHTQGLDGDRGTVEGEDTGGCDSTGEDGTHNGDWYHQGHPSGAATVSRDRAQIGVPSTAVTSNGVAWAGRGRVMHEESLRTPVR